MISICKLIKVTIVMLTRLFPYSLASSSMHLKTYRVTHSLTWRECLTQLDFGIMLTSLNLDTWWLTLMIYNLLPYFPCISHQFIMVIQAHWRMCSLRVLWSIMALWCLHKLDSLGPATQSFSNAGCSSGYLSK